MRPVKGMMLSDSSHFFFQVHTHLIQRGLENPTQFISTASFTAVVTSPMGNSQPERDGGKLSGTSQDLDSPPQEPAARPVTPSSAQVSNLSMRSLSWVLMEMGRWRRNPIRAQ